MIKHMSRVITVYNQKTSMRLTDIEWHILDEICFSERLKRKKLLEQISAHHSRYLKLTPAVRLFSLLYLYNLSKNHPPVRNDIDSILHKLL